LKGWSLVGATQALIEFEKAERAKPRATDRAKPNEPETSSAAGSSLTRTSATGLHADTTVLGSHRNIKKARSMGVLGEGSDRSRQSIKRAKSTRTLRELERAPRMYPKWTVDRSCCAK